ncbi:MAG: carbohydrate kinase family protein [Candidatus Thorarchaeota archaeon]
MGVIELDYSRLIGVLQEPFDVGRPVIMPDFFVDHFVINGSFEDFIRELRRLAEQGGGNLLDNTQFIRRGGNAVNTASALLSLGVDPVLIVTTDDYGARILPTLVHPDLDLSHVHKDGRLSSTVSIEADYEGRRVNLMVSDSGSASDFAFSDLTSDDLNAIQESSLVALLNLNHNADAPRLAVELFEVVSESSHATKFIDIGDPSGNQGIIEPLARQVLSDGLVDIISLNENEARWFAWTLTGRQDRWKTLSSKHEDWLSAAELTSKETGVRVDLHTQYFVATIAEGDCMVVPTFQADCRVALGAGDAWNAGDILGTLLHLPDTDRLTLANSVAALYVSSASASHPSLPDVVEHLSTEPSFEEIGERLVRRK